MTSLFTLAYVTYHDIRGIDDYNDQTVVAIKAPPETRLEVPDPTQEIQIWLKSTKGPIEVFLCPEDSATSHASQSALSSSSCASMHANPVPTQPSISAVSALDSSMVPALQADDSPSKSSMSTATCSEESNDSFKGRFTHCDVIKFACTCRIEVVFQ